MRLRIDQEVCGGTGACVRFLPQVFDQDEDGLGVVVDPSAASEAQIEEAIVSCPTGAITLKQD